MRNLINRKEVLGAMVDAMMEHDAKSINYQQDIYLYIDADGKGEIEIFANVGGNNWIPDDHITVYCMKECVCDWTDYINTEDDIANVLECSVDTLRGSVATWMAMRDDEHYDESEITYNDVYDYLTDEDHGVLLERVKAAYEKSIYDSDDSYMEIAEAALDESLAESEAI